MKLCPGMHGMNWYAFQIWDLQTKNKLKNHKFPNKHSFWYAGMHISPGAYVKLCPGMHSMNWYAFQIWDLDPKN